MLSGLWVVVVWLGFRSFLESPLVVFSWLTLLRSDKTLESLESLLYERPL
jgi:hypothetical protein